MKQTVIILTALMVTLMLTVGLTLNANLTLNRQLESLNQEHGRLEQQLERSFAKLSTAMENMDKASSVIESQVMEYRKQVDTIDKITPVAVAAEDPAPAKAVVKPVAKKSLTDSVLDTISRLLEK
jgi:hypothetical protein